MNAAARHIATVAPSSVRIGFKAAETDLVSVRYLESEHVVEVTLGAFLDANIGSMTDAEVDSLYAGDKVTLESRIMGPYVVWVNR